MKVRVLYPTAFAALGVDAGDQADVTQAQAKDLIAQGYAEAIEEPKAAEAPKSKATKKAT
jgi:hypothetical protein